MKKFDVTLVENHYMTYRVEAEDEAAAEKAALALREEGKQPTDTDYGRTNVSETVAVEEGA